MYIGKTRSGVTVILLSIVTCGIYAYFWYYTILNDINRALNRQEINPALFWVGIFCCPLILWYILYKVDKGLGELAHTEGTAYKENFTMWLLLTIFCGIGSLMAMVQITDGFNSIWARRQGNYGASQGPGPNAF